MNKLAILAAVAALATTPAFAADSPAAGQWAVEAKTDFGTFKSDWTVAESADGWTLDMKDQPMEGGPGGGDGAPPTSSITNVKVDGGHVTFDRALNMGGQAMNMSYDVMVEGDALTGKVKSDFGDIPITGTRK